MFFSISLFHLCKYFIFHLCMCVCLEVIVPFLIRFLIRFFLYASLYILHNTLVKSTLNDPIISLYYAFSLRQIWGKNVTVKILNKESKHYTSTFVECAHYCVSECCKKSMYSWIFFCINVGYGDHCRIYEFLGRNYGYMV